MKMISSLFSGMNLEKNVYAKPISAGDVTSFFDDRGRTAARPM
jgi:hypothetical protein